MKIKTITIIFMMLMLTVITFMNTSKANETINVKILKALFEEEKKAIFTSLMFQEPFEVLNDYTWYVNNTRYNFSAEIVELPTKNKLYLQYDRDENNLIIMDGNSWDQFQCIRDNDLREDYREYIKAGGGFIGRCGGSVFPLRLNEEPDTTIQRIVDRAAFLEEEMKTKTIYKMGIPVISEYFKIKRGIILDRPILRPRFFNDPTALGFGAYSYYNGFWFLEPNNQSKMSGECDNLTNLDKEHPILKDYHGDTLFFRNTGGCAFEISKDEKDWVKPLATYPSDSYENSETKRVYAWTFGWTIPTIIKKIILELIKIINCNIDGIIPVDKLPTEFQTYYEGQEYTTIPELSGFIISYLRDWTHANQIIKTGFPGKPAIIAFNYQNNPENGRVVLTGPHIYIHEWYDGKIVTNEENNSNTIEAGLYHWENESGGWLTYNSSDVFLSWNNTDTNPDWYLRREAAWTSRKVPDDHLPPVYGRSQVVDINPVYQNSSEFTIECCVGKNSSETWDWNNVNLTLYYRCTSEPGASNAWIPYESKYDKPYYFIFNASNASGPGDYEFCSRLQTEDEYGFVNESFPPGPDAKASVQTAIYAEMSINGSYFFAGDYIYFNSNNSSTNQGTIDNYYWDFDDGTNSTVPNPTHIFAKKGVYNVTLTIENDQNESNTTYKIIEIHNNLPVADFTMDKNIVFTGENINLTDFSYDADGEIVNHTWDFDDGANSTMQNTSHLYSKSGIYEISLETLDDDNDSSKLTNCILVIDCLVNQTKPLSEKIFNSLQQAVENSSTNNFIYIENESYYENIIINKSINLIGEDKNNVIINSPVTFLNPYDYELPNYDNNDISCTIYVNMTNVNLLMHFNNDTNHGENYFDSDLVFDYSGMGFNGTKNNNVGWSNNTLKGEGCFIFNENDNGSVNLSSIPALCGENVTVSTWVYWNNSSGLISPVLSQCDSSNGYCLFINSSNGKPCFQLDDTIVSSSSPISCNTWHHIAGTHNQTLLKIYVDGILQGSVDKNGSGYDTPGFIGFDNDSNYFNGGIDEVAVWNRTLLDDEISMIYDANYGINIMNITLKDTVIGVIPCNHSSITYCDFINTSVGIILNNSNDINIQMCNITNVETGISVVDSNPDFSYFNRIVDCNVLNVANALMVNNSTNLFFIRDIVNGTYTNLSITNSNFSNISVMDCNSINNYPPDVPSISGPSLGEVNTSYTFYACTNDSNDDQILYKFDWDDGNISSWIPLFYSNETVNTSHVWTEQGGYLVKVMSKDVFDVESNWSTPVLFRTETLPPIVNSFNNTPGVVGFGGNITITANVTDNETGNYSGIKTVHVNIIYPDDSTCNYTMNNMGDDVFEYVFMDTWLVGQYNYSICAVDNAYNWNNNDNFGCFNVSSQANMSICTIKDTYENNDFINITDPPGSNPTSQGSIGYELLDNGSILHIWNNFDHYYFNTTSGIQLTNHYNKYWSHNVLMLGYYNNDQWNLVYRTDNLSGFNKNIDTDNETYVNATLWKNLNYQGYDFRLAIRYHLCVDDKELTIIPYIKNLGQAIQYNLGFAWELKDIQVNMTSSGDYLEINGTTYYLNQSLDETYKNMNQSCFYIRENISSDRSESLYLCWNDSLDYLLKVKSREGQYNAPVTLGIKIGTLAVGQEKYTSLLWHDASEITYYFNSYNTGEAWSTNPSYMVDESPSTCASTTINGDVELCNGNNCSGNNLGTISKVELRVSAYYTGSSQRDTILRPVFNGVTDGIDYRYQTPPGTGPAWSSWFDITNDPFAPESWSWTDVKNLDCDVEAGNGMLSFILYCSKVEIRITYTSNNNNPEISNPYPADDSTGISITPTLNITVADPDGDNMSITWLSNSSGSWQVFGTNNSIGNGTYHQTMANASVNGEWWYWKVNVTDVINYTESSVYKFYTGYESKINNTGSTSIKGYLLIQVQYYNDTSSSWVIADDTVNETTSRTINSSGHLALDTIFNGLVNTSDLINGDGLYRIYACFRDPYGNVLVCDNDSLMEATYECTIS